MNTTGRVALLALSVWFAGTAIGQQPTIVSDVRGSAAYAEVLLRKTEVEADIAAVTGSYTETNPRLIGLREELAGLQRAEDQLFKLPIEAHSRLTLALGRLMVRKAGLEAEHGRLSSSYNKDHPEVVKAQRRVDIFTKAINRILTSK